MSQRLANKVAFITGGNSGLGLAIAKEFVSQGAQVAILARTQEKADQATQKIGAQSSGFVGDVSDLASLQNTYDQIKDKYGKLDIVVANAGIAPPMPMIDADEAHFDSVFEVNVKGSFFTVKYALPLLAKGSSVILISSCLSEMGMAGFSIYNASKAAIRSLARSLTPELLSVGGRINVLSPGPVDTGVLEKTGMTDEQIATQYAIFKKTLAAGRPGKSEEIAKTALFLASADSSYLYGSDIQADGGMNQTRWPVSF